MGDRPDHFKLSDWARLAWYITLLIARGPDLEYEIEQRVERSGMDPRRISPGYVINAQRIGSAIVRARWSFMWSNELDLVLGDRGVTGMYLQRVQAYGYFVPLRRNFGVVITAGPYPKKVRWSGQDWTIEIESSFAAGNRPNMWTWLASRIQTYGSAPDVLTGLRDEALQTIPVELHQIAPLYQGAQLLSGTQQERRKDELILLNLLAGIPPPENGEPDEFSI